MLSTSSSETVLNIVMQRCLLMLLLCLSDVAVHGDFRFRREVNETVEPTSIAFLRTARSSADRRSADKNPFQE